MNVKNSVLDYMKYKQLNWCGKMQRMNEERIPLKNCKSVHLEEEEEEEEEEEKKDAVSNNWNEREGI